MISEASKLAGVTKKAVNYYIEQDLIFPDSLENGYRGFSDKDVERLKEISALRKLGLSIEEIKMIFADETSSGLQKISVQKELSLRRDKAKKAILDKLSCGYSFAEIDKDLKTIEQSATITEKLLNAFPGYYGRFICLHFARFLNEPITTGEQQAAYAEIISFLDNAPPIDFPKEIQSFLVENTKHINTEDIHDLIENTKRSIEDPQKFLTENRETIEQYLQYKQSAEYKQSPVYHMQRILKEYNRISGYYEVFIPAMKKLSTSYAKYYEQIESANEKLLLQYPEF
ncbi:MerR family transcriptional regulator [Cytobacillus massiliigabonensis]|uniref:MerR family transcriptional regulator n=1 Tax=Cytobacillus massiliigabonensis TaxID=1871011 RepID=UPI001C108C1A|nr:MerR family transcriptional regulator [Cytobacillus massiliigabonensis]